MKLNHPAGGKSAFKGAINWGIEIAWLLIAVLGVGIYSGVLLSPRVSCAHPPSSQVECDFKSFESALAMYKLNGESYPSTAQGLKALVEKPTDDPIPVRWVQIMPKIPLDPWGNAYFYQFPGSKNPDMPEIISNGPDGIKGTGDDPSSQDE